MPKPKATKAKFKLVQESYYLTPSNTSQPCQTFTAHKVDIGFYYVQRRYEATFHLHCKLLGNDGLINVDVPKYQNIEVNLTGSIHLIS